MKWRENFDWVRAGVMQQQQEKQGKTAHSIKNFINFQNTIHYSAKILIDALFIRNGSKFSHNISATAGIGFESNFQLN